MENEIWGGDGGGQEKETQNRHAIYTSTVKYIFIHSVQSPKSKVCTRIFKNKIFQ